MFGTGSCSDLTEPPGLLNLSINGALLADAIDACDPIVGSEPSCEYSLNIVTFFQPLLQTPPNGGNVLVGLAESCVDADGNTATTNDITCTLSSSNLEAATYQSLGAGTTCLEPHANTKGPGNVGNYNPAIVSTTGPCAKSEQLASFEFAFEGISIGLQNVQVAAQYQGGEPAATLTNGLLRGFVPESAAHGRSLSGAAPVCGASREDRRSGE